MKQLSTEEQRTLKDLQASGLTRFQAQQAIRKMRAEQNDLLHDGMPVTDDPPTDQPGR